MELKQIESIIREGEILAIRAKEKHSQLKTQYTEKKKELEELGIDPKHAEAELQKRKQELEQKKAELLELLPIDVIEKYKGYDFSGGQVEPNLDMPF